MSAQRRTCSERKSVSNERKVCVVTGSSSGIGAATVRLYAQRGWNVVVNFSREAAPAEAVAAECRAVGAEAIVARADVASDVDCRAFAAEVQRRVGADTPGASLGAAVLPRRGALVRCLARNAPALVEAVERCWNLARAALLARPPLALRKG